MKKKSQIRYVILIFAVITGFTCIFTTGVQGKSTKLIYEAEAVKVNDLIQYMWMEDDVTHVRYYREESVTGTMGGIEFTSYSKSNWHFKIEASGDFTVHGEATSLTTWNGLIGTFHGHVNGKGFSPPPLWHPLDGYYNCKVRLQGAEDFKGWKLSAIGWLSGPDKIELSGTVLIPK